MIEKNSKRSQGCLGWLSGPSGAMVCLAALIASIISILVYVARSGVLLMGRRAEVELRSSYPSLISMPENQPNCRL